MMKVARIIAFLAIIAPCSAALVAQEKKASKIVDEAGLFSKEAIERAGAIVSEIDERHQRDLLIETYEKSPDKDLATWAKERVKKQNINGVYLVITNEPKRFQVQVSDKTLTSGVFKKDDLQEILKILPGLAKDRDATLEQIAKFTLDAMNKNTKGLPEWPRLTGFWLGSEVQLKKGDAKGELRLQFLEVEGKPVAKIGYQSGTGKDIVKELTGTYPIAFSPEKRDLAFKNFYGEGKDLMLSFKLQGEKLSLKTSTPVQLTGVAGETDLSGVWKRVPKK